MTCPLAHDDAAYVLGALPPEERLAFERHLADCPECARSVQQIAGLPGLLSRVPADVVASDPEPETPPDTLLPAVLREIRRAQARRRWFIGAIAAAVVLAVSGGTVAVVQAVDSGPPPAAAPATSPSHQMTQLGQDHVDAKVALTSVPWGTRLDVVCSYEGSEHGYHEPAGPTYALVVRSNAGEVEQVATWHGLPGRTMTLTAATALRSDDIESVEIRSEDGHPILELGT